MLLFMTMALLTACEREEAPREEWPVPMVTVISGTETYFPIEDFNYAQVSDSSYGGTETIAVNGGYLAISHVWGMPKVPYRPDLEIRSAREPDQIWYQLWDGENQAKIESKEAGPSFAGLELPEPDPGQDYTVELQLQFGEEGNWYGYQYFFQVTAEEPLPKLRLTCRSDGEEKEIPTEQGAGAFPVLMRQEELPVLARDGEIGLSFVGETVPAGETVLAEEEAPAQGTVPVEIQVFSVDLTGSDGTGEMILAGMGKEGIFVDPEKPLFSLAGLGLDEPGIRETEDGGPLWGLLVFCRFADGREGYYAAAVKVE